VKEAKTIGVKFEGLGFRFRVRVQELVFGV
jgi:hypothetical protein